MRTLYDPERDMLIDGAKQVLSATCRNSTCYLISRNEGQRMQKVVELEITDYFKEIILVPEKNKEVFCRLIQEHNPEAVFVVGDRIEDEISIGNSLGCKTVWFQNGKFANRLPEKSKDRPWKIITELPSLLKILKV